tara:strand:- start:6170 stop:7378 length:1209 start_codon:yes stop_codon:yes gene_type:complete
MTERTSRIESIDALRGLVMIVMVLDHVRHAFMLTGNPENVATTTAGLFLTRWVTHFCAPVFVFLAGTSAWLYGSRGRSKAEVARFLATRGLWLVVLEVTVVSFGWMHTVQLIFWQVIAAIGVAMMVLAALLFVPRWLMIAVGVLLVAGQDVYNLAVAWFQPDLLPLWRFLQGGMFRPTFGLVPLGPVDVLVIYPVLPWIGVLTLGYAFGGLMNGEADERRARFLKVGAWLVVAFVVLRSIDSVGNVRSFWAQAESGPAWMAFLACEKYPPSLAYLLMTLGPALIGLALFERVPGAIMRTLQVFGRVPLFFYVLHLYMVQSGSRLFFWIADGEPWLLLEGEMSGLAQAGLTDAALRPVPAELQGADLFSVYLITAICVAALYPLCRWFGELKRRNRSVWLSYL